MRRLSRAAVSGKSGTPAGVTAGASVNVTVNAVDANWNLVTSATPTVAITSSDVNATLPANAPLVAGTRTFSVTLRTAGSRTVTATDVAAVLTPGTSAAVTVSAGAATALQVLLPGETAAPGSPTGKTGSPTDQTVGGSFLVVVRAVDGYWNLVTTATPTVAMTSTDPLAALPTNTPLIAGTRTFAVILSTATSQTITASDVAAVLTPGTSAAVLVLGTTLTAPTAISIGSGFPGQTVTSAAYPVSWLSTEIGKRVTAVLTADASDGAGDAISATDIVLITTNGTTDTVIGPLSTAQDVAIITSAAGSQLIKLRLRVPSAVAGTYTVSLRFDVVGP